MRNVAALLAALATFAIPATAQTYASGKEAYDNRDWGAAERIWTEEADAGSAEALLGLGNLLDFGLTGPSDPAAAFDFYRQAALLGMAEAGFNVAVMLDSGVGTAIDRRAAAGWYSLAALDDFPRAQYNLGQMYATGDGVPLNTGLAEFWLERSIPSIPSSRDVIESFDQTEADTLSTPEILRVFTLVEDQTPQVRLAWASGPGPAGSRYRVEVADRAAGASPRLIATSETRASALAMELPSLPDTAVARVFQLTDLDYAVSSWTGIDGSVVDLGLAGRVRFQIASGDRRGRGYAERLGASLQRSGIAVDYDLSAQDADESAVFFGYEADALLARSVADFLPGVAGGGATRRPDLGLAPAEVLVRIVFRTGG